MSESLRIFWAFDLGAIPAGVLARRVGRLRDESSGWRWTDPSNWHVTMVFLGDVPRSKIESVTDAGVRASEGHASLRLGFDALGVFPSRGNPRVLMLGLAGDLEALVALHSALAEELETLGFPHEERAYAPHLTLARSRRGRRPEPPESLGLDLPAEARAPFAVAELVLYRSELGPGGPRYTALARVPLE